MADFKEEVLHLLEKRDTKETTVFNDLFTKLNLYFQNWKKCEDKIFVLESENAQLKSATQEMQRLIPGTLGKTSPMVPVNPKEIEDLKNQIHEKNQIIYNLSEASQKLASEQIKIKDEELSKLRENEQKLTSKIYTLQLNLTKQHQTEKVLKEELQMLQSKLIETNEKMKELTEQHLAKLEFWLQSKNEESTRRNLSTPETVRSHKSSLVISESISETSISQKRLVPSKLPTKIKKKIANDGEINSIVGSNSGKLFATGGVERKIKIYNVNGDEKMNIRGCQQAINKLDFSSNDQFILAPCNDTFIRMWCVDNGRLRHTLAGHQNKIYSAKFNHDSTKVISGSYDLTLRIWDLITGGAPNILPSISAINDLCIADGSGNLVITAHVDHHLRFWDFRAPQVLNELGDLHSSQVTSVCVSPDGTKILTNSQDNVLKLIDLKMLRIKSSYIHQDLKTISPLSNASFSSDGQFVSSGSANGTVFVWDTNSTRVSSILNGHSRPVYSVSWDQSGENLFSAGQNIIIWES